MVSQNLLPELSLDLGPPVASSYKPVLDFLSRIPVTGNWDSGEITRLDDFITKLDDELKKIQAFKRELPLSCLLLNDAIVKLKEKLKKKEKRKEGKLDGILRVNLENEKKNWMSSAQLWSPRNEEDDQSGDGGVFPSLSEDSRFCSREEQVVQIPLPKLSLLTPGFNPPGPGSRSCETGGVFPGSVSYKQHIKPPFNQTGKKQRRCWSPELHRRFVDALEKLGGSQVATPKQIRELMQVDGLTNDEVKSHLQKYRLHIRKLPSSKTSPPSSNEMLLDQDQLELGCLKLDLQPSESPEGPLNLAGSGKCNSASMGEDEEKSDS